MDDYAQRHSDLAPSSGQQNHRVGSEDVNMDTFAQHDGQFIEEQEENFLNTSAAQGIGISEAPQLMTNPFGEEDLDQQNSGPQGNRVHFQEALHSDQQNQMEGEPFDDEAEDTVHDLHNHPSHSNQGAIGENRDSGFTGIDSGLNEYDPSGRRRSANMARGGLPPSIGGGLRDSQGRLGEMEEIRHFSEEVVDQDDDEDDDEMGGNPMPNDDYDYDQGNWDQLPEAMNLEMGESVNQFVGHMKECNIDFKDLIIRKAQTIQLRDLADLNKTVEEVKKQESRELNSLNRKYQDLEAEQKDLIADNERSIELIGQWIKKKNQRNIRRKCFKYLKIITRFSKVACYYSERADEQHETALKGEFLQKWKNMAKVAGNKLFKQQIMDKVENEINVKVHEKMQQLNFLESMMRELEEKYKIEQRKKAILKTQADQAYLRGASAISMEALKMSNSTLGDFYKGMKMPNYDGKNIFTQIRSLNGASTGFEEVVDRGGENQN